LVAAELRSLKETLILLGLCFDRRFCGAIGGQRNRDAAFGADTLGAEGVLGYSDGSGVRVVETVDDGSDAEAAVGELLLNASLAESSGVVGGDTVVVGIKGLDKVITGAGADDILAVVHVDQTGGRELGGVVGEGGGELALVVVVALGLIIVDATNVDDGVAGSELFGIAGTDEGAVRVCWKQAQQVDGQSLVGVEVAAVGSDERT
ncbi:metal-dependent protein hydrolase, partial [Aureobasidium melanogenum]